MADCLMCFILWHLFQTRGIMTIPVNEFKPAKLRSMEADFGTSVSSYIWNKIIHNHAWVEKAIPIGYILYFYKAQTDAAAVEVANPNSDIWVYCDGSVISDADSPLNGQNTPDLRTKFLKGSDSAVGTLGGQETINLQHNHGGATGFFNDAINNNADSGSAHDSGSNHNHALFNSWSTVQPVVPVYFEVQAFMRYK